MDYFTAPDCDCKVYYEGGDAENGIPPWMNLKKCAVCKAAAALLLACITFVEAHENSLQLDIDVAATMARKAIEKTTGY
jgi:hypothetical protein